MKSLKILGLFFLIYFIWFVASHSGGAPAVDTKDDAADARFRAVAISDLRKGDAQSKLAAKACEEHSDWKIFTCQTIAAKQIAVGMTAEQLRLAWGRPQDINKSVFADHVREQWVYGTEYVYVDDGVVSSYQVHGR